MKIYLQGRLIILHPAGVAFLPDINLLVASDLHLEKGSHFAPRGYFLPPYDSHETLQRLLLVCEESGCQRLMLLGDCFHDNAGYERLDSEAKALFHRLLTFNPVWIRGNHDDMFRLEGLAVHDLYVHEGLAFRHEALLGSAPEISGHFHPKIEIRYKGGFFARRCFIEDGNKLMLPAFGAYTGGLSIADQAIRQHFQNEFRAHVLGEVRLFTLVQGNSGSSI